MDKEQELFNLKEQYDKQIEIEKEIVLGSKSEGISKSLYLLSFNFESSPIRTPQYLEFHRTFKREFTKILKPLTDEILFSKPNHFDVSGFFRLKADLRWDRSGIIYYFNIGDLRWDKEAMLIRTAKSFEDYTGGRNNYINLDKNFVSNLYKFLKGELNYD